MIDFHTHPVMIKELVETDEELGRNVRNVFGLLFPPQPLEVFLNELDAAGIERAVLLPLDCSTAHACRIVSNEQVAELVIRQSRFVGFASVDPSNERACEQLTYAVRKLGLRGLKLDPAIQQFSPNCRERAYPLYALCCELGIPVVIHCGLSWSMQGLEKYAHPLQLGEVAHDFPDLNIVIPHFAWPWVNEAMMLALKYKNIYLDTSIIYSGTPREAFGAVLAGQVGLSELERDLHTQVLFGSNYPRTDIRRSVRGLQSLELSTSLRQHISDKNASRLLGL